MARLLQALAPLLAAAGLAAAAAGDAGCAAAAPAAAGRGTALLQIQASSALARATVKDQEEPPEGAGSCSFTVSPGSRYFWDPACARPWEDRHGGLGCRADGLSQECRFCGGGVYAAVSCPGNATWPHLGYCEFGPDLSEPLIDYFWDSSCRVGMLGCKADGKHAECRFCGSGAFEEIACPTCTFTNVNSSIPTFWDNSCRRAGGGLGCRADGIHEECRFCGMGDFANVTCPESLVPSNGSCSFPNEPTVRHYWEGTGRCKMGVKGCNADGIHVQCRFCGDGAYSDIPCP